jgi:hypothetical protein
MKKRPTKIRTDIRPRPIPPPYRDPVKFGLTAMSVGEFRDADKRALAAAIEAKLNTALSNHKLSGEMQSNIKTLTRITTEAIQGKIPQLSALAFLHLVAALDCFLLVKDDFSDEELEGYKDDVKEVVRSMSYFHEEIDRYWNSLPPNTFSQPTYLIAPRSRNPLDNGLTDITVGELMQNEGKAIAEVVLLKIDQVIRVHVVLQNIQGDIRDFAKIARDALSGAYCNLSVLAFIHILAALDYFLLDEDDKPGCMDDDIKEFIRVQTAFKSEIEYYKTHYLPNRERLTP